MIRFDDLAKSFEIKYNKYPTSYYDSCNEYLQSHIGKNNNAEINKNPYYLTALNIYLKQNSQLYNYYLTFIDQATTNIYENLHGIINNDFMYRHIDINQIGIKNLIKQSYMMNYNIFEDPILKSGGDEEPYNFLIDNSNKKFIFVITKKDVDNIKKSIKIDDSLLDVYLGIEVINFLEHQNLERFLEYFKSSNSQVKKSVDMFIEIYNLVKSASRDNNTKNIFERSIFFSGFVIHTLGTSYTSDADLLYYGKTQTKSQLEKVKKFFANYPIIEAFIYDDNDYNTNFIGSLISDPSKHYHFMGIKIVKMDYIFERLYLRATAPTMVDMIMLNKINGINITPCIPLISTFGKHALLYDRETIRRKILTVKKYLKEWHNIDISYDQLNNLIRKCKNYPNDPPFSHSVLDIEYTNKTGALLKKYFSENITSNKSTLIIEDYNECHVYERYIFNDTKSDDTFKPIIIGPNNCKLQDEKDLIYYNYDLKTDISKSDFYNNLDPKTFDNIYIFFNLSDLLRSEITLFYKEDGIGSYATFVNNIKLLSHSGTKLIINYLDGSYVESLINKYYTKSKDISPRIELTDNDNLLFGLYKYDNDRNGNEQFVIYLKNSTRYGYGRIELLLTKDKILSVFSKIGFELVSDYDYTDLTDSNDESIKNLDKAQKVILKLFRKMTLKRK